GRRGVIFHRYGLAALGGVAASVRGPPGARGVEGIAAVTGEVGDRADDGDGHLAARVTGARRIKGPPAGALDGLVGHAGDGRRRVIFRRYGLPALDGVAAGIGGPPRARGVEGIAAMAGEVGDRADNGDGHLPAGVAGARRIKGPDAGALDGLVGHAGDGRRRV